MPAVCRDSTAVGTCLSEIARICSPKPGNILSQTASVASGVTSLGAGPVPPVVMMSEQPSSQSSINACSISFCSSSTRRREISQGEVKASSRKASIAGPLRSSYSPALALSEAVRAPTRQGSPPLITTSQQHWDENSLGVDSSPPDGYLQRPPRLEESPRRRCGVEPTPTHTEQHRARGRFANLRFGWNPSSSRLDTLPLNDR